MKSPMDWRKSLYVPAVIAAVTTLCVYGADRFRARSHQTSYSLQLARQIASQTEALTLSGRQKNVADPLGWAIRHLTQGVEPRVLKIVRDKVDGETYRLSSGDGVFEYRKNIQTEAQSGVRIQIRTDYRGFFGAHSRLASDFLAVLFFLAVGAISWYARELASRKKIRPAIEAWIAGAKTALLELGGSIRNLIREAHLITQATAQSRQAVTQVRNRIHGGIKSARSTSTNLSQLQLTALQAEVTALNLVVSAAAMGQGSRHVSGMAEELHEHIKQLKRLSELCEQSIQDFERELEPIATDADIAFHSFEQVFTATGGMDAHISQTSQSLLKQAQQMQSLRDAS